MSVPDLLMRPSVSVCLLACVIGFFYTLKTQIFHPLGSLSWVGRKRGEWFANTRARRRAMEDPGSMHTQGYSNYSKKGSPFYFPTRDGCDTVILPPSQVSWLANQPEAVVSSTDAMRTILMTDYLFDPHAVRHPIHNFTTRVLLTRKLPQMVPVMAQELKDAFAERLGSDTEKWKEVQIVDTLREISGRTVNRVFIGDDPLCQNQEYLDSLLFVAGELDKAAAKLRKVHWLVRPLVASYITRPYQKAMRKVLDFTNPIVIRRKEAVARQDKTQLEKEMEEPDDFLQFLIQQSITQKNDIDPTPNMISLRLALMNFASVQNLSRSGSNTILDLVNAPPELNVIETLRQEISDVTAQDGEGALSKDQLGKMERLDSVIKESMRISHVSTVGIQRMVTAPNGIPVPGGRTVPKGFLVGTSAISLHLDDDYYPNAKEWRPFRFYEDSHRPSDPKNDNSQEAKNTEFMRQKRNALTFTSDEFLAFGHGTHACPGRFYSAALLKTLIIVLLQEYDLRPQTERAENEWVSGAFVPSANATVQVRKKKVPMSGGV